MSTAVFTINDLKTALEKCGIKKGSTLLVHSSLLNLGKLDRVTVREYPALLAHEILDYLGSQGTLVVPSANYEYGAEGAPFNLQTSSVSKTLGVFSQCVFEMPEATRSANPMFSLVAVGRESKEICRGSGGAFGAGSAWDHLFKKDADILFLGCELEALTFTRYIEHHFGVPYLYTKFFHTPVFENEEAQEKNRPLPIQVTALLRYKHLPIRYDHSELEKKLRKEGKLRETSLGAGKIMAVKMSDCFQAGIEGLKENIHFFLAEPPHYSKENVPLA